MLLLLLLAICRPVATQARVLLLVVRRLLLLRRHRVPCLLRLHVPVVVELCKVLPDGDAVGQLLGYGLRGVAMHVRDVLHRAAPLRQWWWVDDPTPQRVCALLQPVVAHIDVDRGQGVLRE